MIQLVGVLCLIGGCLGLVVYAILSIDEEFLVTVDNCSYKSLSATA